MVRTRLLLLPLSGLLVVFMAPLQLHGQSLPSQVAPGTLPLAVGEPIPIPVDSAPAPSSLAPAAPTPAATSPATTTPPATSPGNTVNAPAVPSGKVTIESDQQQADQTTGIVTATGNVRILYPDQRVMATARQAQYFTKEDRVVLSGDVDVIQEGGNQLRAEQVTYLIKAEKVIARPARGTQVFSKMIIQRKTPKEPVPAPQTPALP